MKKKLSKKLSLADFECGYWYVDEMREFAVSIDIPGAKKLRKDELEDALRAFFETGELKAPRRKLLSKTGQADLELGLSTKLPIKHYTSNRVTKEFIKSQALKREPSMKNRSGAWYRLNRWREDQLEAGLQITYGDLIDHYIQLCTSEEPFAKVPQVRYINFLAEFLAKEKGCTRQDAIDAWHEVKRLDIPNDYKSWLKFKKRSKR